jgi:hypothetical protein
MDKPDVKESIAALVQKLGFLKNYSSLLAPFAIFIAAIVVLVVNHMMVVKLSATMKTQSLQVGDTVKTLLGTAVSKDQWLEEQKYQDAYRQDANQIVALMVQSTQRPLLSYKLFPQPVDKSSLIFEEFGQKFCAGIGKLLDKINAGDCPTTEELTRQLSNKGAGDGDYSSATGVDVAIRDVLCLDKAKSSSVYINPVTIAGFEHFWNNNQNMGIDEAINDSWFWQIGYWVVEDVIGTIGKVNYGSNSVFASPVKRLIHISFNVSDQSGGNQSYGETLAADNIRPAYAIIGQSSLKESCTARFANENIDVVHFNVSVLVDSTQVADFMKELCSSKEHAFEGFSGKEPAKVCKHNQISILSYNSFPINRDDPAHALYRYGDDAILQLDLTCEYIFIKAGYDPIKPESIKAMMQQAVPPTL